jgi:hypothetical protein
MFIDGFRDGGLACFRSPRLACFATSIPSFENTVTLRALCSDYTIVLFLGIRLAYAPLMPCMQWQATDVE